MKNRSLTFFAFLFSVACYGQMPAPITGGPAAVCAGTTFALTDATSGGIWSSSDPATASVGLTTGIVTGGSSGGTVVITYTTSGGSVTITIVINPIPTAFIVTGGGSYCTGGAGIHIGLTGSNAGIAYQLMNGAVPVGLALPGTGAALDFGLQTAIGTYTIIATNAMTGCSRAMTGSAVISIGTPPLPITGPSTMCLWSTITLSDATAGGTWSCSSFAIATISPFSGEITAVASGVAVITYTAPTGCSATKAVTVTPAPVAISGPSTVCISSSITLSDGVSGGVWTSSNTAIATTGSLTGVVTGVSLGTATIVYSLGTGCVATKVVTVTPGACSGTPMAGTSTSSTATLCPGSNVILRLSGVTVGCGITYQWQHSADGSAYTDMVAGVTDSFSLNPVASEYYRCKVTCTNSGLFSYSSPVFVSLHTNITSHSVITTPDTSCTGAHFYISACGISPSFNVTTFYGDGKSDNTALTASGICHADIFHAYPASGTYFIKQVLYIGTVPQDSIGFSCEYLFCRTLPIKFYLDANSNSIYDSGDGAILLPVRTEIDSNGIPIDTVSVTSGLYYKAHGPVGTVYAFKVIATSDGFHVTSPVPGILYDTIQAAVNDYHQKFFGLNCASAPGFDLAEHVTALTGRHQQNGTIIVDNTHCTAADAIVTLHFSPSYVYNGASPAPFSHTGNTITWHLPAISSSMPAYPALTYYLGVPGAWLLPGDTVNSDYVTLATTGTDIDTSNNVTQRCDTVKSSYDPNEISVLPQGKILPCTKLQYTINFENTGNDTAHNISVLDTLDDNLDPHTLNIEIASSAMNIAIIKDAGHNVIKFDFPGINLLDSSHHGKCDGMVIYNIKTRPGLTTGTSIFNYAGIFFDDNPAVTTNTVANTIGMNPITGPNNVCAGEGITLTSPDGFGGGAWSSSSGAVATVGTTGAVTGVSAGPVTITYSISGSCGTIYTTDAVTVKALPAAHAVTGGGSYCAGGTGVSVGIASSDAGVNYLLYRGAASTGPFTGTGAALDFGLQTLAGTYTVAASGTSTGCHNDMPGSVEVTITPTVAPSVTISTGDVVCAGASTTFTPVPVNGGTTPTYVWNVNGVNVGVGGTYIYLPANGDVVTTTLTSNAPCAVPATASGSVTMTVEYPLTLTVLVTASPGTSVVSGEEVTFAAALSGGGIASFQWDVNGTDITGATNATYTTNTLNDHDLVKCTVKTGNACGDVTATNAVGVTVSNNVGVHDPHNLNGTIVLSPNPNQGAFTIQGFTGQAWDEEVSVQITNMMGQVVYKNTASVQNGNINIPVRLPANLAKGVYMLGLHSGSGNRMVRFVVE